jgi:hypothetical protein
MESQEGLAVVAEKQLPMTHQDEDRLRRQNNVRCQDEQNIDTILIGTDRALTMKTSNIQQLD